MEFEKILTMSKKMRENIASISYFLFYQKRQQYFHANGKMVKFLKDVSDFLPELSENLSEINGEAPVLDIGQFLEVFSRMQTAQEMKDYVMLADILELQILPAFVSIEERLVSAIGSIIDEDQVKRNVVWCHKENPQLLYSLLKEELINEILSEEKISENGMEQLVQLVDHCVEKGVAVEPTSCGYSTMALQRDEHIYYLHTNGNIIEESLELAWEWLMQEKEEYTFYGLGLGYPYLDMLLMDHNISVRVFETNKEMLLLGLLFAPLDRLYRTGRFELIYDPTGNKMKHEKLEITRDKGFYIFYPALNGINKALLREQLENYFVDESSVRTQYRVLDGNFKKNSRLQAGNINDLSEKLKGREVIIVAAGPSLDQNMELLKKKKAGTIIIAAGTVLKKLLKAGIRPDFVIMTDGHPWVYTQIREVEDCGVPLIFLSTVFSKVPKEYQGEKYLLCQKGYEPAEDMARKNQWELVESGGSVMTTALDACLRLKVKRIIFVGLDLAYTGAKDHASDTALMREQVRGTEIEVASVDGGKVQTSRNLKIYLEWIEKRLSNRTEEERKIPVIDATEGGAKKKGMEIMTLQEAME